MFKTVPYTIPSNGPDFMPPTLLELCVSPSSLNTIYFHNDFLMRLNVHLNKKDALLKPDVKITKGFTLLGHHLFVTSLLAGIHHQQKAYYVGLLGFHFKRKRL